MVKTAEETTACHGDSVGADFDAVVALGSDPHGMYARARVAAPVFYSERYGVWCVTRNDDIVGILRDPKTFSAVNRSVKPSWAPAVAAARARLRDQTHVANTDPPKHAQLRQILNQTFSANRVAAYEPTVERIADSLLDRFDSGVVDLVRQFTDPFPLIVILQIIGIPLDDMQRCQEWIRQKAALDFNFESMSVEEQVAAAEACLALQDYCDDLVRNRQTQRADDLVSDLLDATPVGGRPLTVHEISDHLPTLILAGHETTSKALSSLLWHLLSHPDELDGLRRHPEAIPRAVEEGMRLNPPALAATRRATKDVRVGAAEIPAGSKLLLLLASGNRDEARWHDGERFLLHRDHAAAHLAFGYGIHFCLGASLSRLEARVGLQRILSRQPTLQLAEHPGSLDWSTNFMFRGLVRLPVHWLRSAPK